MTNSKKNKSIQALCLLILSFNCFALLAQQDDLPPTDNPPPSAPIDEGLVFLVVAGVILAARVFYGIYQKGRSTFIKEKDENINVNC